jgi:DNA-binding NtrC family response regulator
MLSILLVDDEPTLRLALGDALAAAGHQVVLAEDGQVALDICAQRRFDVVVSDVNMPKVDGITLLQRLKRMDPSIDFVLMTAFPKVPDVVATFKRGIEDYLPKPFANEELVQRLSNIEARRSAASGRVR